MRLATRTGQLHSFADDKPRAEAFAANGLGGPISVPIFRGGKEVGRASIRSAELDGDDLLGEVEWPQSIEDEAGDEPPTVHCEFDDDGSLVAARIELPGADPAPEAQPDPKPEPRKPDMPEKNDKPEKPDKSADLAADVENAGILKQLIAKHGSLESVAMKLVRMNKKLGADLKDAQDAAEKAPKVPEGSTIAAQADIDALAAYRELGDPKAVKQKIADAESARDAAANELTGIKRRQQRDAVARDAGYAPTVFNDLADRLPAGATFEPVTVKVQGKDVPTYEARWKGEDGKDVAKSLADLEADEWKDYVPALKGVSARPERDMNTSATGYRGDQARQAPARDRQAPQPDAYDLARFDLQHRVGLAL